MEMFGESMLREYFAGLSREALAYAAHYAHHALAGTLSNVVEVGWACSSRERARVRAEINARIGVMS